MAHDKRFGIDIPTDKQVKKYMTKLELLRGLDNKIRQLMNNDSIPHMTLGLKAIIEFAKLAGYYDKEAVTNTTNIAFVYKSKTDSDWELEAAEHDKLLSAKLETDTRIEEGDKEQSSDSDRHTG